MEGDLRQPRSGSGGKKYRHVVLKSGLCESIAKLQIQNNSLWGSNAILHIAHDPWQIGSTS